MLAAIFAYPACMQWRVSQEPLRTFQFRSRAGQEPVHDPEAEVSNEIIQEFNKYGG